MRSAITFSVFILQILAQRHGKNVAVFKFTNVFCDSYNKSLVIIDHCYLKAVQRNLTTLYLKDTLLINATKIEARIRLMKKANGYKPWIIDYKVNICEFIRRRNQPFVKIIWNLLKDFSNMNHSCPYIGPQEIKGMYVTPEMLLIPLPSGDYGLFIDWFVNKKVHYVTNVFFSFQEDPFQNDERVHI